MTVVGAARAPFAVPLGTAMGGFAARTGPATSQADPLEAAVLCVRDGDGVAVVVVLDLVGVDRELARAVAGAVSAAVPVRVEDVLVAATHTHSGPAVGERSAWTHSLLDAVATAVSVAWAGARECRLLDTSMPASPVPYNRRRPGAAVPSQWPVLAAVDEAGAVVAALLVAACHPVVRGAQTREWSADYVGHLRRAADAVHGGTTVVLQGVAGDVNPGCADGVRDEDRRIGALLGGRLGAAALGAVAAGRTVRGWDLVQDGPVVLAPVSSARKLAGAPPVTRRVPIAVAASGVPADLQTAEPRPADALVVDRPAADPQTAADVAPDPGFRARASRAAAARLVESGDFPVPIDRDGLHACALRLAAGCVLVALPGEPFAATQDALRAAYPEVFAVVGYADGYAGYLLPAAEFARDGYEAGASALGPAGEPTARAAATEALRLLRGVGAPTRPMPPHADVAADERRRGGAEV